MRRPNFLWNALISQIQQVLRLTPSKRSPQQAVLLIGTCPLIQEELRFLVADLCPFNHPRLNMSQPVDILRRGWGVTSGSASFSGVRNQKAKEIHLLALRAHYFVHAVLWVLKKWQFIVRNADNDSTLNATAIYMNVVFQLLRRRVNANRISQDLILMKEL